MKINIKDKELNLKYSFRSMMIYEKITGVSFNPRGITEIIVYFYSTILASDKDIALTLDEFVDWIDEHPNMLNDFSVWMTSIIEKNSTMGEDEENSDDENSKKK